MASLLIRNVDTALHARLKARAAAHHRSFEEEARVLLRTGLAHPDAIAHRPSLLALANRLFGAAHGVDLPLPSRDPAQDRSPPGFASDME
jgi:plasmid stability protein